MSAKDSEKSKQQDKAATAAEQAAGLAVETGGDMDQIRDILFGAQMKKYDRKLAQVQEQILGEISEAKDDFKRRLNSLEEYIKSEVQSLSERIDGESESRGEAVKNLAADLKEAAESLDKRLNQTGSQLDKSTRDLRQQLLDLSKKLSDELEEKHKESLDALSSTAAKIRDDMVYRTTLSGLFTETAIRLSKDDSDTGSDNQ